MELSRAEAATMVEGMLEHFVPDGWTEIWPDSKSYVTHDGMLYSCHDYYLNIGFGVRTDLTPSAGLLKAVANLCSGLDVGHLWLCPESETEEDNWNVVWGFKLAYGWWDLESFKKGMVSCQANHKALLEIIEPEISPFGGSPYWQDKKASAAELRVGGLGLVLLFHIG